MIKNVPPIPSRVCVTATLTLLLSACMTVGPDFQKPQTSAPADWSGWTGAGPELSRPAGLPGAPQSRWWEAFNDPILDSLLEKALTQNPDLRTAALHYAQSRARRDVTGSQQFPDRKSVV